jgi:hypothetical protein
MIHVAQHVPGWADVEPKSAEVATVVELLAIPWIASWSTDPTFHRYAISDYRYVMRDGEWRGLLMAELDHGFKWWVLAHVTGDWFDDLPEWHARYKGKA